MTSTVAIYATYSALKDSIHHDFRTAACRTLYGACRLCANS